MKVTKSKANCMACGFPLRKVIDDEFDEVYYTCTNIRCHRYNIQDDRPRCEECGDVQLILGNDAEHYGDIYYICENKDCPNFGQ